MYWLLIDKQRSTLGWSLLTIPCSVPMLNANTLASVFKGLLQPSGNFWSEKMKQMQECLQPGTKTLKQPEGQSPASLLLARSTES